MHATVFGEIKMNILMVMVSTVLLRTPFLHGGQQHNATIDRTLTSTAADSGRGRL